VKHEQRNRINTAFNLSTSTRNFNSLSFWQHECIFSEFLHNHTQHPKTQNPFNSISSSGKMYLTLVGKSFDEPIWCNHENAI